MTDRGGPDFGVPDASLALVSKDGLTTTSAWLRFFVRLAQLTPERAIGAVSVGASPFDFAASTIGNLLIEGGTVSDVTLTRGAVSVACPLSGFIPMAGKDVVTITWSVLPTVTFIPSARA